MLSSLPFINIRACINPLSVARAVSTIIGTLFFVMIASMFIILVIRSLYIYGELTGKLMNAIEAKDAYSDVSIQVIYSELKPVIASSVTTVEVLQGYSANTDPALLDYRDGECIQVEAESTSTGGGGGEAQLIKNGDFSEGLTYWSYSGANPWTITYVDGDPAAYYQYAGRRDTASIWQGFILSSTTTSATLSFTYTSSAFLATRFRLTVSILKEGDVVWSKTINLLNSPSGNPSYDVSNVLSEPGNYELRFTLIMRGVLLSLFTFTLDNVSLIAQVPAPPTPPGAAYIALIRVSASRVGLGVNGTLTLKFNNTVNLKVFIWAEDRWRLSEEDIGLSGQWFNTTLGEDSLLQAYSTEPFMAELDYLALTARTLVNATMIITNEGGGKAEIYAAWLRNSTWEARVARYAVLFPGESLTLQFNTTLTPGCEYEARVVTATRVFSLIFKP